VLAGAGVAGGVVSYASDPEGTRDTLQSFRQDIDEKIRYYTEPSREKLLPDAIVPYPGAPPLRTLVIDLDNTLVHSSFSRQYGWRVAKRPGAEAFLAYLSSLYEIVVFTDNLSSYADPILNRLDPNRYYISYRLYRAETKYEGGVHIKDLEHLNRDLSRVILIDHNPKHFKYHPENAIEIPKWTDDAADTSLLDLIPFLEQLVHEDCADVREEISRLHGKPLKTALAEHRSLTSLRAERPTSGVRGGLFGTSPTKSTAHNTVGRTATPSAEADGGHGNAEISSGAEHDSPGPNPSPMSHAGKKRSASIFRPSA
jgi:import inner membrane translocase subunit TIM50